MSSNELIHPTAIIHSQAKLASDVRVGPYSIIGSDVHLGANCWIDTHVHIKGRVKAGANNKFYHSCIIGEEPQDIAFEDGEHSMVSIGDNNVFREYSQVHRSKEPAGTKIGNNNFIMTLVHIGHDATIGNHNILVHSAILAGHVIVEDYTYISAITAVQQHTRIGSCATVGGVSGVTRDVVPYVLVKGECPAVFGLNTVGMRRMGLTPETRKAIKHAYKILFREEISIKKSAHRIKEEVLTQYAPDTEPHQKIQGFLDFIMNSKRGIVTANRTNKQAKANDDA